MTVSIQETNVSAAKDGYIVQIYVSDAPRDAEFAAIRLALTAKVPQTDVPPLLAQVQYRALQTALEAMDAQLKILAADIQKCGRGG